MIALFALALVASATGSPQQDIPFSTTITKTVTLDHLLYLPRGYADDPQRRWPLIVFLHGSGERGHDLEQVKVNGLPKRLDAGFTLPCVVISPQCPPGLRWTDGWMLEGLNALIDDALTRYRIDAHRVYLTGMSMGGFGTWALGAAHPEKFAALAPVCGGGDPSQAFQLRRIPIWGFHGAQDTVVPVQEMKTMADAMERVHGTMRLTIYPDAGHDAWTATYDNPELYTWMLAQVKTPPVLVPLRDATLTASSGDPSLAADGDPGTRWESAWSDPQWLAIDLHQVTPLHSLTIFWETAYAKVYDVLVSADGDTWTRFYGTTEGDGDVDVIDFPAGTEGRHLRLDCHDRGTQWGDSIWEIELE